MSIEERKSSTHTSKFSINGRKYEIDEIILDSHDKSIFHLYRMDSDTACGVSIDGDFLTKDEAKNAAIDDFEKNFS